MYKLKFFVAMLAVLFAAACNGGGIKLSALSGELTINPHENVTVGTQLSATYTGSEAVRLQWHKDGLAIPGAVKNQYTPETAGNYSVVASAEGYLRKSSNIVTLVESETHALSGEISISPTHNVTVGTQLSATYSGTESVRLQWHKDNAAISGAVGKEYTPETPGNYSVVASAEGYHNKSSNTVTVIERETPELSGEIRIAPNQNLTVGTPLSATYSGTESVRLQWHKDNAAILGAVGSEYTPENPGIYWVVASAEGYRSKSSPTVEVEELLHTVTFDYHGTLHTEEVAHGSSLGTKMPTPTEPCHTLGWVDNSGNPFTASTPVRSDLLVTAIWTTNNHAVRLMVGGNPMVIFADCGSEITLPLLKESLPEKEFLGWLINGEGELMAGPAPYTYVVEGDVEIHARWRIQVNSAEGLDNVRKSLASEYILTAHIDLASYPNWLPIGTEEAPFKGKFDGDGFEIANLKIDKGTANNVGLFAYAKGAQLSNLILKNLQVTGKDFVGGIVGHAAGSKITLCFIEGVAKVHATGSGAGGIVGYLKNNSEITEVYSAASVSAAGNGAGGIAGFAADSKITGCSHEGDVEAGGIAGGGIAGYVWAGAMSHNHNYGKVFADYAAGGIVGVMEHGTITSSSSTQTVEAAEEGAGGIAGYIWRSKISDSHSQAEVLALYSAGGIVGAAEQKSTISNCYSEGNVEALEDAAGGIVGYAMDSSITRTYSKGNMTTLGMEAGGIAGYMWTSEITYSYSTGKMNAGTDAAGGIVGYMWKSTVANSYSTGEIVAGTDSAGGIVGQSSRSTITNTYSTGDITAGESMAGGIVGYAWSGELGNSYSTGKVSAWGGAGGIAGAIMGGSILTNCAAINPSINAEFYPGRILGYNDDSYGDNILQNHFAWEDMVDLEGETFADSVENGIGKSEAALKMQASYDDSTPESLGWDFTTTWEILPDAYPTLQWP